MKAAATVLSLALIGCSGDPNLQRAAESVFLIDSPINAGTAVVVRVEGLSVFLLTAGHVARMSPTFEIEGLGTATVVGFHPKKDAAMLVVESASWLPDPIPMRFDPLKVGEPVWSIDFSGDDPGSWIDGGYYSGDDRITITAWFRGSGGAILDRHGQLAGILVRLALYDPPKWTPHPEARSGHAYLLPLSDLDGWLR